MANLFESKPCGRCGGSGKYSYCSMYGSMCFGCGGRGEKLTKRGAAAQAMFSESMCKPAGEIKVGERFLMEGIPGFAASKWFEVRAIEQTVNRSKRCDATEWTETPALRFVGVVRKPGTKTWDDPATLEDQTYGSPAATKLMRVAQTAEERAAKVAAALAYQETLTASGTPRKRKAVVA